MNNNQQIDPALLELAKQQVMQEQQQTSEEERRTAIRQVVSQLPKEPFDVCQRMREELALALIDEKGNPFWPAIVVATSVINVVEALKAQMQNKPNGQANIKAFQDLMIGLESNPFWSTHRAQLIPVVNMILQANLSAIRIAQGVHDAEFVNPIDQLIIDRALGSTYEIVTAVMFAAGGQNIVNLHDVKLRRAFYRDQQLIPVKLDKGNTAKVN